MKNNNIIYIILILLAIMILLSIYNIFEKNKEKYTLLNSIVKKRRYRPSL